MKLYKRLYLGDNAKEHKYVVLGIVLKKRLSKDDIYLITLSDNDNNLLDIISSNYFLQPHFKKKFIDSKLYVVGLAKGYEEALEVVRTIIDEVYSNTGGFDIPGYLNFGKRR